MDGIRLIFPDGILRQQAQTDGDTEDADANGDIIAITEPNIQKAQRRQAKYHPQQNFQSLRFCHNNSYRKSICFPNFTNFIEYKGNYVFNNWKLEDIEHLANWC